MLPVNKKKHFIKKTLFRLWKFLAKSNKAIVIKEDRKGIYFTICVKRLAFVFCTG